jgi:hypothetical protein
MSDEVQQVDAPEVAAPEAPQQSFDNSPQTSAPQGSVYDAFKQLPEFQGADDVSIARTLYQSMQGYQTAQQQLRQYQQYMPETMEWLKNKEKYQTWQQSQQAPQPSPEQSKWWNPPQVKETWRQYIVRDPETGREIVDQNAPLEAQAAIRDYQAYTADFAKRFVTNPEDTLKPFIEQVAIQKAQELVQQQLGQYTAQNYVQSLEQRNADWLYDQTGQISSEGRAIQGYIEQAAQVGINSPEARWQFATSMLERDLLNMRYQQMAAQGAAQAMPEQPPPAEQAAQQNMQFLRERATRTPSRSGGATEPRAPKPKMTLEERLKSQLVKDGLI